MTLEASALNRELLSLLDHSQAPVQRFIRDFIDRLEAQRRYDDKVKAQQVQKKGQPKPVAKAIKDVGRFLVPGRQACYCQCTRHGLVNNCVACGKVVCEQEGEGPCLFCGAWVDREASQDVGEDQAAYEQALRHRDRLIEFDVNAAQRLGVLDAQSDWFDLANNTWLNKEQRTYAKQMQEVEQKRQEDIDSKMNVTIDLARGTTDLKVNEEDKMFSFASQNKMVNEYLGKQTEKRPKNGKFLPFEEQPAPAQNFDIASFTFKAYVPPEEKQAKAKQEAAKKEEATLFKKPQPASK